MGRVTLWGSRYIIKRYLWQLLKIYIISYSEVTMFNIQWRLIAAVEFVPGHFKTWVNVNLEWKIIDDSVINDAKRLKTNILCYRMLLYQRIE